ncbi:EAL domain-containing protein [Pseudoroseomonas wenyumeiae]|uniref:EAL domain-containing protein n=1 Tax=Teichococcus wenyumeiae TaxID=2478470 RepID=A0A3A9J8J3_9PROT|nr:EAL domain-containing protein [Pseudoroseomonas wenyumeiae]RKK03597.1 EAL domain-containing protein [Pseudoroseomonas wenyumeiae]RMI27083.1 EAL domain-containing protein [Pseudoroseomonas wenyumeiae]
MSLDAGLSPTALLDRVRRLERRLLRQNSAREQAERLLEQKSLELYEVNRSLIQLNASLEQRVEERTRELERERQRAEEQAHRDSLTGLPNRLMFRKHMRHALSQAAAGSRVGVLYLDLDGFKHVNDTLGHPVGDDLLRAVARRLLRDTRQADLVARLGGDEFALVQMNLPQPEAGGALAEWLIRAIQEPFTIGPHQILVGTSIGFATADAAGADADALLRDADIALYAAKAAGRGTWRAFRPDMDARMQARRQLETDLRCAMAARQFEVFYQPLLQAGSGELAGFEALLRWNHPERGRVPPAEFIPLAGEIGLIRPLGAWVLRKACQDAAQWPVPLKIAVNLSPVQFTRGQLVAEVEEALATSRLAPDRLELEITESLLLRNSDATLEILHRLRALGVQISMDDFGTGYSSLSYLHRFPFDKIKIDQSFIRTLAEGKGSLEIIRAVVGLGRALSMKVLAEGVETPEQLATLRAEGCDEVQGYLFSQPASLQETWRTIALNGSRRARA